MKVGKNNKEKKTLFAYNGMIRRFPVAVLLTVLLLSLVTESYAYDYGSVAQVGDDDHLAARRDNFTQEPLFGGGSVIFTAPEKGESQQLGVLVRSGDGKLLAVDGGRREEADHMLRLIKENGGKVDTWLITHPQADHAGALHEILVSHPGEIEIGQICCGFLEYSWYALHDPEECGLMAVLCEEFSKLPEEKTRRDLKQGDMQVLSGELSFRVLNDPQQSEGVYAANSSGLMFDIVLHGKHIVILGDMGPETGNKLMEEGALEGLYGADLVQLSHHGQNGVTYEFYKALSPKAVVWPAPLWLYGASRNNGEGYTSYYTRVWINRLGIQNVFCTKNGDVRLH